MLLYHIPDLIWNQATSLDCFRPLAEAMVDYALFHARVWKEVCVDGTLDAFLSTAQYQLALHVRSDTDIDDAGAYPSFELEWRRLLATRLKNILPIPPAALCPSIHRVIPIGVSSSDAIQAMEVAIPNDIQDPYAITVQSSAVDDRCGSIAITQPMRSTVIHVHCLINPGLLIDVCRELRVGHKAVVTEVHSIRRAMTHLKDDTNAQLSTVRGQLSVTNTQLSIIQKEMTVLVKELRKQDMGDDQWSNEPITCSRKGCSNTTTKRFRSGKRQKQCRSWQVHGVRTTGGK
jgi:hypothetical protein